MSAVPFVANATPVSTGTAAKTLLQLVTAANHAVLMDEWGISFNGTSPSAEPIKVELCDQDTAGTSTALTMRKLDDSAETLQTTALHAFTAEPTTSTVIETHYIHPQDGLIYPFPFNRRLRLAGGKRLGIRVTAPVAVTAAPYMKGEE